MLASLALTGAATTARLASGLGVVVALAHALGAEGFGRYAFWLALATAVALICDYGFNQSTLRTLATADEPSVEWGTVLRAKYILVGVCVCVMTVTSLAIGQSTDERILGALLCVSALMLSFSELHRHALRAVGKYKVESLVTVAGSVFSMAPCLVLLAEQPDVVIAGLLTFAGRLAELMLVGYAAARTFPNVPGTSSMTRATALIRRDIGFAADSLATNGFTQVDVILTRTLYGDAIAGIYQVGARLTQACAQLVVVTNAVFVPRLARLLKRDGDIGEPFRQLVLVIALGGLGVAVLLTYGGPYLIEGLFATTAIAEVSHHLALFSVLLIIRLSAGLYGIVLVASGNAAARLVGYAAAYSVVTVGAILCVATRQHPIAAVVTVMISASGVLMGSYVVSVTRRYRSLRTISVFHLIGVSLAVSALLWTVTKS